jgi:large subunit ribosomal protein L24
MKIHTGDSVYVISGKDKGKTGTVIRVLAEKNRVVVEGINMRVRHIKKTTQGPGQRLKYEASISASNVMLLDPKTKKPTRVGYKVDPKTGAKQRVSRKSGEVIPVVSQTKAAPKKKTAAKKSETDETPKAPKAGKKEEQAEVKAEGPVRQPFWKRAFAGGPQAGDHAGKTHEGGGAAPQQTIHRSSGEGS